MASHGGSLSSAGRLAATAWVRLVARDSEKGLKGHTGQMDIYTVVKVDGATPKRCLVRGHDKPIHGSCAIYFPGGIYMYITLLWCCWTVFMDETGDGGSDLTDSMKYVGCLWILLMVQKSFASWVGSLPQYLKGFTSIPGGAGFLPPTVRGEPTSWNHRGFFFISLFQDIPP